MVDAGGRAALGSYLGASARGPTGPRRLNCSTLASAPVATQSVPRETPEVRRISVQPAPQIKNHNALVTALHPPRGAIQQQIDAIDQDTGIIAYKSRDGYDEDNLVHQAIHAMRWEPHTLFSISPQRMCEYEVVLASAQAYVHTLENQWRARYEHLGRELDRVMSIRRESHKGATEAQKENNLLAADPALRKVRNDYIIANAVRTYLDGMGKSFVVLAQGIKRSIDQRAEEFRQSGRLNHHSK